MAKEKIRLTYRQAVLGFIFLVIVIGGAVIYGTKSRGDDTARTLVRLSDETDEAGENEAANGTNGTNGTKGTACAQETGKAEEAGEAENAGKTDQRGSLTEDASGTSQEQSMLGVHVTGAVKNPDQVYFLPEGSRVLDAINAAGGALLEADLSKLNLARYIQDSEQIRVPFEGEDIVIVDVQSSPAGQNAEDSATKGLTNINSADKIELMGLPGIGEVMAEKIIRYREENGPFGSIEDLQNVPGIGTKKFEELRDKICVY